VKITVPRKAIVTLGAVALAATMAGCRTDDNSSGLGDSPVGVKDNTPAQILNFPDDFSNVAHKCDGHGHRVFVNTRDNTSPVVIDDPTCGSPR
jgi:hypothetical protein